MKQQNKIITISVHNFLSVFIIYDNTVIILGAIMDCLFNTVQNINDYFYTIFIGCTVHKVSNFVVRIYIY